MNRSGFYYRSKGEFKENLGAMKLMDQHILEEPTARVLTMQNMFEEQGLKNELRKSMQINAQSGCLAH